MEFVSRWFTKSKSKGKHAMPKRPELPKADTGASKKEKRKKATKTILTGGQGIPDDPITTKLKSFLGE